MLAILLTCDVITLVHTNHFSFLLFTIIWPLGLPHSHHSSNSEKHPSPVAVSRKYKVHHCTLCTVSVCLAFLMTQLTSPHPLFILFCPHFSTFILCDEIDLKVCATYPTTPALPFWGSISTLWHSTATQ